MSDKNKGCLRILKVVGLIFVALIVVIVISIRIIFGKTYDKKDLIKNYEKRYEEIYSLKDYMNSVVPDSFSVYIEFEKDDRIDLRVSEKCDTAKNGRVLWFQYWDINPYDYVEESQTDFERKYRGKTKSLDLIKNKLNWTDKTFKELKLKLDNANCISVMNGNKCEIGFQRSFMSKYYYLIFDENLDKKQQDKYSDDCMVWFYKDNIVFKYGSGAIGSLCTPEFKRDK